MFHMTTTVGAGRLGNMASATHSVKSHRKDGNREQKRHVYFNKVHLYVYVYYTCITLNIYLVCVGANGWLVMAITCVMSILYNVLYGKGLDKIMETIHDKELKLKIRIF